MVRPAPQAASEGQNGSFHWETEAERTMTKITRIGIDLGKSTLHVCGVDRHGEVVIEKKFTRRGLERFMAEQPPCLVGLEACVAADDAGAAVDVDDDDPAGGVAGAGDSAGAEDADRCAGR